MPLEKPLTPRGLRGLRLEDELIAAPSYEQARIANMSPANRELTVGVNNAKAMFEGAKGAGAALLGNEEAAAQQAAAAQALIDENAKYMDGQVTDYDQVNGLRSAGAYARGAVLRNLPAMIPTAAAQMITRRPLPTLAAGAVPSTVMETGEAFTNMANDPVARQNASLRDIAAGSLGKGVVNAALDTAASARALGKLPTAAEKAARPTLTRAAGHVAKSVGTEGVTEAIQEGVGKGVHAQFNDAVDPLSPESVHEYINAGLQGGAAGGALSLPAAATQAIKAVKATADDRAAGLIGKAKEIRDSGVLQDNVAAVKERFGVPLTPRAAEDQKLAEQDSIPEEIKAQGIDAVADYLDEQDQTRSSIAARRAKETLDDPAASPEDKALAAEILTTPNDQTSWSKAAQLGDKAGAAARDGISALRDWMGDRPIPKKNAQDTELAGALRAALVGSPEYALDPKLAEVDVGELTGMLADYIIELDKEGDLDQKNVDVIFDKLSGPLQAVHRTLAAAGVVKPDALTKVTERRGKEKTLLGTVMTSMLPEVQNTVTTEEAKQIAGHLRTYVERGLPEHISKEQAAHYETQLAAGLIAAFGDKTDAVIKQAAELYRPKERTETAAPGTAQDEDSAEQDVTDQAGGKPEEDSEASYTTHSKTRLPVKNDRTYEHSAANLLMRRAKEAYPSGSHEFVSATQYAREQGMNPSEMGRKLGAKNQKELDEYVVVKTTSTKRLDTELSLDDINRMKIDKRFQGMKNLSLRTNDGKITLSPHNIVNVMEGKQHGNYTKEDLISKQHRVARMFFDGISSLAQKGITVNEADLQDSLRIKSLGGKHITLGDIKKLEFTPKRVADPQEGSITEMPESELRREINKLMLAIEKAPQQEQNALKKDLARYSAALQHKRDAAELERNNEAAGRRAVPKEGNIHEAAVQYGEDNLEIKPENAEQLRSVKKNAMAVDIHRELGKDGFAATHDSPIKHEGKFNWREHIGKGEGNAAFGAGTYLSTANGVHKAYKGEFTAKVSGANTIRVDGKQLSTPWERDQTFNSLSEAEQTVARMKGEHKSLTGDALIAAAREDATWQAEIYFKTQIEELSEYLWSANQDTEYESLQKAAGFSRDQKTGERLENESDFDIKALRALAKDPTFEKLRPALEAIDGVTELQKEIDKVDPARFTIPPETKSPTYQVTVNIKPEELLDWDKPLSEQSELVKKAFRKTTDNLTWVDNEFIDFEHAETEAGSFTIDAEVGPRVELVFDRDGPVGSERIVIGEYENIAQAKQAALDYMKKENIQFSSLDSGMTGGMVYADLANELGSQAAASGYLQSLGILGHKYASSGGKNNKFPNYVIYDDSKIETNFVAFDKSKVSDTEKLTAEQRKAIEDYVAKVTPGIKVEFKKLFHSGEFEKADIEEIVRISVYSINPLSVAHHEAMHGFFSRLDGFGPGGAKMKEALLRAANSAPIKNQLNKLLEGEKDALEQLNDPEERLAYMYQFWAAGKLRVGDNTDGVFSKVKALFKKLRNFIAGYPDVEKILAQFHTGDLTEASAVARVMNQNIATAQGKAAAATRKVMDVAKALGTTADARLRDTEIPALITLADKFHVAEGVKNKPMDFHKGKRAASAKYFNEFANAMRGVSQSDAALALEALQREESGKTQEQKELISKIRGTLEAMHRYLTKAGVELGYLPNYFPRVYDMDYIAANQKDFLAMLDKYEHNGKLAKGSSKIILQKLTSGNGFADVHGGDERAGYTPAMAAAVERALVDLDPADVAPFLNKDLVETMTTYIAQATTRGEYTRRFGAKGEVIEGLLAQARSEGATDKQIDDARKAVRANEGTLGSDIDPRYRKLQSAIMVYQNIRLLPLSIFSSLVDPMGIMVRGGSLTDSFRAFQRGIREIPDTFRKEQLKHYDDDAAQLAEDIGIIDRRQLVDSFGNMYGGIYMTGTAKKINDAFFKYNMMEGWNRSMRVAATQAGASFIKKHARGDYNKHSKRYLEELGLTSDDLFFTKDGKLMMTAADGLTNVQAAKMTSALHLFVDGAVLRPNAAQRPIWMSDPHYALIAHLKQFTFSFYKTIIGRTIHEVREGNMMPLYVLTSYVPFMIAADVARGIVQNGGEEPDWKNGWTLSDYVWNGVQRAGLTGTGQFFLDVHSNAQHGGSGVEALFGPTVEQTTDILRGDAALIDAAPANPLYKGYLGDGA